MAEEITLDTLMQGKENTALQKQEPVDVETVRTLADRSLEQAVLYILRYTLGKLLVNGSPICRDAWEAYNQLVLAQTTENL